MGCKGAGARITFLGLSSDQRNQGLRIMGVSKPLHPYTPIPLHPISKTNYQG